MVVRSFRYVERDDRCGRELWATPTFVRCLDRGSGAPAASKSGVM
jgi:hypothetical protein